MLNEEQKKEIKASVVSMIALIRREVGEGNERVSDADLLKLFSTPQHKDALVAFSEGWLACKGMYPENYDISVKDVVDSYEQN